MDRGNYNLVYSDVLTAGTSLDDIYTKLNMNHPKDFRGHSLSVSDIIVVHQDGKDTAYYVDRIGYKEVAEFFKGKEVHIENSRDLAIQIDNFAFENDTYEYRDAVEDRSENVQAIKNSIENGKTDAIKNYLKAFVEESGDSETVGRAKELLKKIDEYKPLAKVEEQVEQNYNMIDNVINNLLRNKDGQEESTIGIKVQRERVSMKEKIAEKKAVIEMAAKHEMNEKEKDKKALQRVVEG